MSETEDELREQFRDALENADFPVNSQFELLPTLPDGVHTRFEAGDVSMTVADLATVLSPYQDFPYATVDELVADVMEGLRKEDII